MLAQFPRVLYMEISMCQLQCSTMWMRSYYLTTTHPTRTYMNMH